VCAFVCVCVPVSWCWCVTAATSVGCRPAIACCCAGSALAVPVAAVMGLKGATDCCCCRNCRWMKLLHSDLVHQHSLHISATCLPTTLPASAGSGDCVGGGSPRQAAPRAHLHRHFWCGDFLAACPLACPLWPAALHAPPLLPCSLHQPDVLMELLWPQPCTACFPLPAALSAQAAPVPGTLPARYRLLVHLSSPYRSFHCTACPIKPYRLQRST
jgi:hypothetical protein